MANSVVINYLVKVAGVKDVETLKAKLTGLTTSKGFQNAVTGVGMGAGIAAWGALASAVQQAPAALMDAAKAAAADETSQNRLYTSIAANTQAWDGNRESIEAVIKERMALAFSDEEQRESLALLVAYTNDVSEALEIQRGAMDLARLKGISLAESSSAIVKGMEGSGRALKELGINVADLTNKQEVLTKVQEKAGGQAEAYADSAEGSFATLQITMDELAETVGYVLLPYLKGLADTLRDDVLPNTEKVTDALGALGQAIDFITTPQQVVIENTDRLGMALAALGGDAKAAGDLLKTLPIIGDEVRAQQEQAAQSSKAWSDRLNGLADALEDTGGAAKDTAGDFSVVDNSAVDAKRSMDNLTRSIRNLARATRDAKLIEQLDLNTLADQLTLAKMDVKQAERDMTQAKRDEAQARDDLEKATTATAKQEARNRIREAKRAQVEARISIEQTKTDLQLLLNKAKDLEDDYWRAGGALGKALGKSLYDQVKRWNNLTRAELAALGDTGANRPPKGSNEDPDRRAVGGTVSAFTPYIVGERGPELFVPASAGTIVPNSAITSPTGGSPLASGNVYVYLDSEQIAARVERRQYFAASVAPVSAR